MQHRHHAGLVALAGDDEHVALAGQRHVATFQPERFGDAQARAVQQRHHGGVARPDPGIAVLAGAFVGIGKTFGGGHLDRFRQALADLRRADRRRCADLALAFPFEKRPNERRPASARISERPPMSSARRIAMKALTSLASSAANPFSVTFVPQCSPEENQALAEVAGIGLQRLGRQPPLGAQMRQPARHLQREISSAQSSSIG